MIKLNAIAWMMLIIVPVCLGASYNWVRPASTGTSTITDVCDTLTCNINMGSHNITNGDYIFFDDVSGLEAVFGYLKTTTINASIYEGNGTNLKSVKWDGNSWGDYMNQAVKNTSSPTFTSVRTVTYYVNNNGGVAALSSPSNGYRIYITGGAPTDIFTANLGGNVSLLGGASGVFSAPGGDAFISGGYGSSTRGNTYIGLDQYNAKSNKIFVNTTMEWDNTTLWSSGGTFYINNSIIYGYNFSGTDFITRTQAYDKTKGAALSKVHDAEYYIDIKGDYQHDKSYGFTEMPVHTCSKVIREQHCYKTTDNAIACYNEKPVVEKDVLVFKANNTVEECSVTGTEGGVSTGAKIAMLEQAVYELKTELCDRVGGYSWC